VKNRKQRIGILAIALVVGFTVMGCGAFTNVNKIYNYLSLSRRVGRSAEGPVPLTVKVNLDENWENLLSAINGAGVRVNLDLSKSTSSVFHTGENGSAYIVSLILPNNVTTILGDFNIFPNLTSLSFPASVDFDEMNPFVGCPSIVFTVTGKGDLSVIENGKALVRGEELIAYPSASGSVTLNNIKVIGRSAFNGNDITDVHFPSAEIIGIRAFSGCEDLQIIDLPSVVTINEHAFANTGNEPLVITLNPSIETIAANLFEGVTTRKNVTLKVPEDEAAKITTMRDAFRGRGWNEGDFVEAAGRNRVVVEDDWYYGRTQRNVWVSTLNNNIIITVEGY